MPDPTDDEESVTGDADDAPIAADADDEPVDADVDSPIEGQILLLAAAKASVAGERVPGLARGVQAHFAVEEYRERYERAFVAAGAEYFLVPPAHWTDVAAEMGLTDRAVDAVRRAHEQQLRRVARRRDRAEEMDAALEVRTAVVVGVDD